MLLRQCANLTIITNSLPLIAGYERFEAKLIVLGGERRVVSGALVGALAIDALFQLRADIALIGASGLHAMGELPAIRRQRLLRAIPRVRG
jgi:DeoR/GlpR family transcriptional regulator of sugar metabolism